jgi:hypothetical protein
MVEGQGKTQAPEQLTLLFHRQKSGDHLDGGIPKV